MNRLFVVLGAVLLSCCSGEIAELELKDKNVLFSATLDGYGKKIQDRYKVTGTLKILNKSTEEIHYSNNDLFVNIIGEGESRTYSDSLSSPAIDVATVPIKPNATHAQNVYWVLPPVKSLAAERLILEWRK